MKRKLTILSVLLIFILSGSAGYQFHEHFTQSACVPLNPELITLQAAPKKERIRFVALGDSGNNGDLQKVVARSLEQTCNRQGCDFILLLGDNFYPHGITSVHDRKWTRNFTNIYEHLEIPFYPVIGNHDAQGSAIAQVLYSAHHHLWNMPEARYHIESQPADFLAMNTVCHVFDFFRLKDKAASLEKPWTFAFGHHSLYSTGSHGDWDLLARKTWEHFFDPHIDFFLSGHNHHLEHLQLEGSDTEFIISGAGSKNYRSSKEQKRRQHDTLANSLHSYQGNGFVWFELDSKQAKVQFIDENANIVYEFTKNKP